jgi:hypothetical protein
MNFGIICMQSQENMSQNAGGTAYAMLFDSQNFANTIQLIKMTNGWSYSVGSGGGTSTYEQLWVSGTHYWQFNQDYTISLTWKYDPYFLKGTRLIGQFEGATIFDFVHTGSTAITTSPSLGEGVFATAITNSSATLWTSTTITPMTIVTANGVSYPPTLG